MAQNQQPSWSKAFTRQTAIKTRQTLTSPAKKLALGLGLGLAALTAAHPALADGGKDKLPAHFPTSPVIDNQKSFWVKVFTEWDSSTGVLHDGGLTNPVYEVFPLPETSGRKVRREVGRRQANYRQRLMELARDMKKGAPLSEDQQQLMALFGRNVSVERIRQAAEDVRFQRGLSDKFQEGLVRSGAYLERVKTILKEEGVPEEIAFLPHVESSYNYHAYSKFGAAGMWQFMRGTGKLYMKVGYEVDERLDPLVATHGAAGLMRENYRQLGNWPLGVTAYNHGWQSLTKIVSKTGTDDLGYLIENYDGKWFKFASKNFYSEFLAARQVATDHHKYFGRLELHEPLRFETVELPYYLDFNTAAKVMKVEPQELADLNPSLRQAVRVGTKHIPKGFTLRVPKEVGANQFLAAVPEKERHGEQKRIFEYVVGRGDTLSALGKEFNVPWSAIANANNLSSYHRLRPGQRIVIPPPGNVEELKKKLEAKTRENEAVAAQLREERRQALKAMAEARAKTGASVVSSRGSRKLTGDDAEGAYQFQDLELHNYDAKTREGEITVAFGETMGHYAMWANVSASAIRHANGMRSGRALRPGNRLVIPFRTDAEEFKQARLEYHHSREEDFYAFFAVTDVMEVKTHRGDSAWNLAQENNIPMWLFYQQNPDLIDKPIQPGMTVKMPVIEEISDLKDKKPAQPAG